VANAVLLATGTRGDVEPLLTIARALRERGHSTTLVTNCGYLSLASRSGIPALPVDDAAGFARFIDDQPLLNDLRTVPEFYARHVVPAWRPEFDLLHGLCGKEGSVIVSLALSGVAALCTAEATGSALVTVFISPPQAEGAAFLPRFYAARLAAEIDAFRRDVALPAVADWETWLALPTASIGNWPGWFGPGVPEVCAPVGFLLHEPEETGPLPADVDALLRQKPVLISGGSGNFVDARFYDAAVGGCAALDRPALVVTRRRSAVPAALPPGVGWVAEIPHAAILSRVSAVIHHGGINTIAWALAAGAPQLVLPAGHDRPDNAAQVRRLGVGRFVPMSRWSEAAVSAALTELDSAELRERCERYRLVMEAEGTGAGARAAAIVEAAARAGGAG
jgi:rhamnosyltransferase subunit B